jgi:hypothetical protein
MFVFGNLYEFAETAESIVGGWNFFAPFLWYLCAAPSLTVGLLPHYGRSPTLKEGMIFIISTLCVGSFFCYHLFVLYLFVDKQTGIGSCQWFFTL